MAREPALRVEGARELRRTLKRAGIDVSDLKRAHREAAQTVTDAATPPVGKTGALAASVRPGATQTAAIVRAGGARVPYAAPIHWGWPARHIEPQPFLTEAAQQTEPVWIAAYERDVERVVDSIQGA